MPEKRTEESHRKLETRKMYYFIILLYCLKLNIIELFNKHLFRLASWFKFLPPFDPKLITTFTCRVSHNRKIKTPKKGNELDPNI